jgi:hypothetical protein
MKMFGFFNQSQGVGSQGVGSQAGSQGVVVASKKKQISGSYSQFNLASIMKMQSTGCKSCRG